MLDYLYKCVYIYIFICMLLYVYVYIYVYKFIQDTMRGIKHDGCVGSVIYSIYTVTCIIHVQVYLYASTSHIYTYTHIYI